MSKYLGLIAICCLVVGCRESVSSPSPPHTWVDMGKTVSMSVVPGGRSNGTATFTTTKGTFRSRSMIPQPFVVGVPVSVRDDGDWACIDGKNMKLIGPYGEH